MNSKIVERSILHYTNKERRKQKLRSLHSRSALIRSARGHSRWMAHHFIYSHTGAGGSQPWDRAQYAGYLSSQVSENIWQHRYGHKGGAWKSKFQWQSDWQLGHAAVISWMNSPGHKANLLNPSWHHIGIGVARNKKRIYFTQNFGAGAGTMFLDWLPRFWWVIPLAFAAVFGVFASR